MSAKGILRAVALFAMLVVYAPRIWAAGTSGGWIDLRDGSWIEGSSRYGGIQPDLRIDLADPVFQPLLREARRIGHSPLAFWEKVRRICALVERTLPDKRNRALGDGFAEVPLSAYVKAGLGDCRQYSLLTHFLLKAAGIGNRYGYVAEDVEGRRYDHAIVGIQRQGELWLVDAYEDTFHGNRWPDAIAGLAAGQARVFEPAALSPGARILAMLPYPRYAVPPCDGDLAVMGRPIPASVSRAF